jgi:hypothetical protein
VRQAEGMVAACARSSREGPHRAEATGRELGPGERDGKEGEADAAAG